MLLETLTFAKLTEVVVAVLTSNVQKVREVAAASVRPMEVAADASTKAVRIVQLMVQRAFAKLTAEVVGATMKIAKGAPETTLASVLLTEEDDGVIMKAVPRAHNATLAFAQTTEVGGGAHTKVAQEAQQELQTSAKHTEAVIVVAMKVVRSQHGDAAVFVGFMAEVDGAFKMVVSKSHREAPAFAQHTEAAVDVRLLMYIFLTPSHPLQDI